MGLVPCVFKKLRRRRKIVTRKKVLQYQNLCERRLRKIIYC